MDARINGFKEFARNYYWNHMTRVRFMKVMNDGFHQQMFVPEKFVKNCEEKFSRNLVLKGPSGNLWLIKLLTIEGELLFEDGWKEFVEAHNIEKGDVLTFEYEGNSCFNVLIYDTRSRCERETSYLARNDKNILTDKAYLPKKRNIEEAVENNERPPSNNKSHSTEAQSLQLSPTSNGRTATKPLSITWDDRKRRKRNVSVHPKDTAESLDKSLPNNHESHSLRVSSAPAANGKAASKLLTVAGVDGRRKGRKGKNAQRSSKIAMASVKQEAIQMQPCETSGYVVQLISNKRPATDEEKARAWELANAVDSTKPLFVIEMRKTHVNQKYFMTIPSDFVAKYLLWKFQVADLRTQDGINTLQDVYCAQHQKCSMALTGQLWRNFVEDNNLQEGDVCVFELSNADDKLVFDVRIFHAVNEVTPFLLKK